MHLLQNFPLLPLFTIALAAPLTEDSTNNITSHLTTRGWQYPWIGFYDGNNVNCDGEPIQRGAHDRPKLYQSGAKWECEEFARPAGTMVKVFWGSGQLQMNEVSAFFKPNCPDDGYAKTFMKTDGKAYECFDMRQYGAWVNVRGGWH